MVVMVVAEEDRPRGVIRIPFDLREGSRKVIPVCFYRGLVLYS